MNVCVENRAARGPSSSALRPAKPRERGTAPFLLGLLFLVAICAVAVNVHSSGQQPAVVPDQGVAIRGHVTDASGKQVAGATIRCTPLRGGRPLETTSAADGSFVLRDIGAGHHTLRADRAQLQSEALEIDAAPGAPSATLTLTLRPVASRQDVMEFSDQPHFAVAGVTDWTAAGGHGADTALRTSESLATATAGLKPQPAAGATARVAPSDTQTANVHRQKAEQEEQHGDPLAAVRDFETAATLDPSEQNYFSWGAELLLHRAIFQAEQVFRTGSLGYPASARMQSGLGSALFAAARYQEAAERICAASDLDPADAEPYLFLGKIQIAAPQPLNCVQPKLARFVQLQTGSAEAKYLYAMSLLKPGLTDKAVQQAGALLRQAVSLDAGCADAALELGVLASAQHDNAAAIAFYRQAVTADPHLAEAHYRLGVAYDHAGEGAQAKQEFALHAQLKKQQADAVEAQRKAVKQFLFAESGTPQTQP